MEIFNWLHSHPVLARLSAGYPEHKGRLPMHYSPVCRFTPPPKESFSHDLHVLSTPPAFALSQDQTLHHISCGSYNPNKTQNSFDFRAYYSIFDELTPLLQGKIKYKHFSPYVKKNFYFFYYQNFLSWQPFHSTRFYRIVKKKSWVCSIDKASDKLYLGVTPSEEG